MGRIAFGLLLGVVASCCWPATAKTADSVRPITDAETVLAVYGEYWVLASTIGPSLILAIWPDGHAVWSEDPIAGGAPYRSGHIPPDRVKKLLARVEADGYFDNRALTRPYSGTHMTFTTILIRSGKRQLKMSSLHEVSESEYVDNTVVTQRGIQRLDGRRRLNVLAGESSDYLFYRMAWAELRAWLSSALPTASGPADGELLMEAGRLSWRERDPVGP
ncbi:MAG: hypothetical protein JW809_15105 [Pirellulales bacterium]|nr:hypothetical protein [Pirellulales bacterium]